MVGKTKISVEGTKFLINGIPTYKNIEYKGKTIEGLLLNSRMIQAIFDDYCEGTKHYWRYPDTNQWDPDRNTQQFCDMLPIYREKGLLGVTVGLQGGGSIYSKGIYDKYINSAFDSGGTFRKPYFDRLLKILEAADNAGMIVIVNYFYFKQSNDRLTDETTIKKITKEVTEWLLDTKYENIMVDIVNESGGQFQNPILRPSRVHELINLVKNVTRNSRRLLVGSSKIFGIPTNDWLDAEDITFPHGNELNPQGIKRKIEKIRKKKAYEKRPRPIIFNEDSVNLSNLEMAIDNYASWGYYNQGYGSDNKDWKMNWKIKPREKKFEELSGFQTLPVNWAINTSLKRKFFNKIEKITKNA